MEMSRMHGLDVNRYSQSHTDDVIAEAYSNLKDLSAGEDLGKV